MGWCGGSGIAEDVWRLVREHIPFNDRQRIASEIIEIFEHEDADTMDEAETLMADSKEIPIVDDQFFDTY